jgi:hypothetical protein
MTHPSIALYRANVLRRGDTPKPVWALVRAGVVIDWYLNKRVATRKATECGAEVVQS